MQPVARGQNAGFFDPACDVNMLAVDAANYNSQFDSSFKKDRRDQYERNKTSKRKYNNKKMKKYQNDKDEILFKIDKLRKTCGNKNPQELCYLVEKLHDLKIPTHNLQAHSLYDVEENFDYIVEKLNVFIDTLLVISDQISSDTVKVISQLVTSIYNIIQNPTWSSFTINFTNLLIQYVPKDTVDYLIEFAKQLFGSLVAHGDSDEEDKPFFSKLFGTIDRCVNNELWQKVNEFVLKVITVVTTSINMVSFDTINYESLSEAFKSFQKLIPDMHDVVDMIYGSYQFIITHWENIISGDWDKLPLYKDEVKSFESEVRIIEAAFSHAIKQDEIFLKDMYKMDLKQFEKRLDASLKTSRSIANRCTSQSQKLAIGNYCKRLYEYQSQWYSSKKDNPSKPQPYAIKIAGPSSCGKSTLTDMIAKTILHGYDLDPNEQGLIAVANLAEKFESTITPCHRIIVADDVANSRVTRPDYDKLLNYINTMPRPLQKAGVDEKGEYYPNNVACLVTTNVDDLGVMDFSNCPESILRRFVLHIDVNIREDFRNEFGGIIDLDGVRYDIYELVLKRFSGIDHEGKILWDVIPRREWIGDEEIIDKDFQYLMKFLAKDVREHKIKQQRKYEQLKKDTREDFCSACGVPESICLCHSELEAHFGGAISNYASDKLLAIKMAMEGYPCAIKECLSQKWLWYVLYQNRREFCKHTVFFWMSVLLLIISGYNFVRFGLFISVSLCAYRYHKIKRYINQEIERRCNLLSSVTTDIKGHFQLNCRKYFAFASSLIALYGVYQVVKVMRKKEEPSSQDVSTYLDKAHVAFNSKDENLSTRKGDPRDYKEGLNRARPSMDTLSATTTSPRLINMLEKSIRVVVIKDSYGNKISSVNGLMVAGNVIMIPAHAVPPKAIFDIETTTKPGEPCAKTKDQKITPAMYEIDEENDFALIVLPSAPSAKSLIGYFPKDLSIARGFATTLIHKKHDGQIIHSRQAMRPNSSAITYSSSFKTGFFGMTPKKFHLKNNMRGELLFNSFPGLCGSPYVDNDNAIIYGIHVAGYSSGQLDCFANMLTQPMIQAKLDMLKSKSPYLITHSEGDVIVNTYGLPYSIEEGSPLYNREDGTGDKSITTFLGRVKRDGQDLMSNARTPYMKTIFEGVEEEFGKSKFKPPTNPNAVEKTMKTLNKLTDPVQHYEHDILNKAIKDYEETTLKIFETHPEDKSLFRIYSQEEALNGTPDGVLSGIPNDTSCGFPINKSKKHVFVRDGDDPSLVQIPREFNDNFDIQSEIDRVKSCWRNGVRSEAIYKTSSKVNELLPNKKAEDKVRKFYGSPIANFIASRSALGAVAEFMLRHSTITECMVGVNATSDQWEKVYKHLTRFNTTNMIAGDFAGFDTRMAAQITTAAANIIVKWYEAAGVSGDDLELVKGALSDIVHPNILIDGDLYRFANGNPSGNLITVQLNSICNSIMMRYCYYAMNPSINIPFNGNVALITYGDDNAMSVSKSCQWYNHTSCQKIFASVNIEYTMADKGSDSVPYIGIEDISFLKRNFVKHETLDCIVAPIELDSIYKKFYYLKKPSESPLSFESQFSSYCDGAFREAYLHGEKFYNSFYNSIKNIVVKNPSLGGFVSFLSYKEMTEVLKPTYGLASKTSVIEL